MYCMLQRSKYGTLLSVCSRPLPAWLVKRKEMHPPLDRPHPDCEDIVQSLKSCHDDGWKKYVGACNDIKVKMDQCFREEKKRLLQELNAELPKKRDKQEEIIRNAFGKQMTFKEYLSQDEDYNRLRGRNNN